MGIDYSNIEDPELRDLLEKVRSVIDVWEVPRAFVKYYAGLPGGDVKDLNRISQIVAYSVLDDMLEGLDFWGPSFLDEKIKEEIKQRVVDYVDRKFQEFFP